MIGSMNKAMLTPLSKYYLEEGSTIDVPRHWWEETTQAEKALGYYCHVVMWDPKHKWHAGVKVLDEVFILKVEGRHEEPYCFGGLLRAPGRSSKIMITSAKKA